MSAVPAGYGAGDKLLFHYTTADTAFRHILPSQRLLLRPYAQMRDPLESRLWPFTFLGAGDEALARLERAARKALNVLRTKARLVSFTIDAEPGPGPLDAPFARGYARARMWEQYGDGHQGVCLCFDRTLVDVLKRVRDASDQFASGPVVYTPGGFATSPARFVDGRFLDEAWSRWKNERERYDPAKDGEMQAYRARVSAPILDRLTDALAAHTQRNLPDLLFTKTTDWESEHEFRIVIASQSIGGPRDGELLFAFEDTLRAVILGERFPHRQISAVRTTCDGLGVDLLRMKWIDGIPTPVPVS